MYPISVSDDGTIWTGTRENGVLLYDSLFNAKPYPTALTANGFATSIEACDGNMYFYYISRDYIMRWDGKSARQIPFPDGKAHSTEALFCSQREGLIVGSRDGIFKLNEENELIKHPLSDLVNIPNITAMHEDAQGRLWIVGNADVACYDPTKNEIVYQFGESDENVRYYRGIEEDSDGVIYVGSYGNGLMVIENGEMHLITTDHGLVENVISSITLDGNGSIWLTGNKGLSRITKEELTAVLDGSIARLNVIFYDEQTDGMRTGEFNGGMQQSKCHLGENRYLFPTLKGAVFIDFDRMMFNELPPPVNVERIIYADSTLFSNDRVTVPYSAGRMDIFYTALSFTSPQNVRFKYRLEGYEEEWTNAGAERKTSYSKLPPGTYDFQVIASNNEGVWNEKGDQLTIEIVPPFYMTTWFKILLVLVGLLLVASITTGVIRRNKKMLMEKQRLRLEAIVNTEERERHRIAKDLHDGVGQLLSSVKMNLSNTESKLNDKQAAAMLVQSKKDIDQITTELRNISYNLLPSSLDKFGLAPAMEEQIKKLEDGSDISIHFNNSSKQERFDPKVEITLYRVFQEMLNNSLKHSTASEITVQLLQFGNELQLMFEDNGKGFNLKSGLEKAGSSGLKNLYSRVALINGNMVIDSHPNSGTVIIVEVKL
jgi:signal transduction histidine kinase